jgi:hypothetical protein
MTCLGSPATLGSRRPDGHNALGSGILERRHHTSGRCWADRQYGVPALGIPELRGFPQVRAGCAACRGFWLDN